MKRNILFLVTISLIALVSSCKKSPLTNGKVITETRELSSFNTLYLYDNIDVTLIRSDSYKIEITTGENLMLNIISEVDGKSLILRNDNICNWLRSYDIPHEAKIYYKSGINSIVYESVGNLYSENGISEDTLTRFELKIEDGSGDINLKIICNDLYISAQKGTNEITLNGNANYTNISHRGLGPINMLNLPSNKIDVYSYESNDIYIFCKEQLSAEIYDIGDIYYKGNPEIKSYISPYAKGKLIKY